MKSKSVSGSELLLRAGRNIFYKAAGETVSRLIYMLFFVYLARVLGQEQFGVFSLAFSLCGLLVILADPGLNTILTRDIASDSIKGGRDASIILAIKIVLVVVVVALCISVARALRYDETTVQTISAMAIMLSLTSFVDFQVAVFNGYEQMQYDAVIKSLNKITVSIIGVIALSAGFGVVSIIHAMSLATAAVVLAGFVLMNRKVVRVRPVFNWGQSKSLLLYGLPLFVMMVFNGVYLKSDIVLMSKLGVNEASIGTYAAGSRVIEMINIVPALICGGILPILALLHRESQDQLAEFTAKTFQVMVMLVIPFVVFGALRPEAIMTTLYGPSYHASGALFQILILASLFIFPTFLWQHLLVVLNRQRTNALIASFGVVLNVSLNVWAIRRFGTQGAAWVAVTTHGSLFVLYSIAALRRVPLSPLVLLASRPLAAGLLSAGILLVGSGLPTILSVVLFAVTYVVLLLVLRAITPADRFALTMLAKRVWTR